MSKCMTFMRSDIVGLVALDFVLRVIGTLVMRAYLIIKIFCVL
jgi:hypothetical protein